MLPRSQLFGADAEYAEDILTGIAGHSGCARKTTVTHLKGDYRCVRQRTQGEEYEISVDKGVPILIRNWTIRGCCLRPAYRFAELQIWE